jgi:hypothetical protein
VRRGGVNWPGGPGRNRSKRRVLHERAE